MNKEIKQLWVAALRSGEYQQGYGYLNRNGDFCCLGVLCDLAVKAGLPLDINKDIQEFGVIVVKYDGCAGILPSAVTTWAEIPYHGGDVFVDEDFNRAALTSMNDYGLTFPQIANVIEAKL